MGRNQSFDSVGEINFAVTPGQVIATMQLGNSSDEELQKIFNRRKIGRASDVLNRVSGSEFSATINLREVRIGELTNDGNQWCVDDFYKKGAKIGLLPCVAEAVILASREVTCNGEYGTMRFAMQPKSFIWGTYGILGLCPDDRDYKIFPIFFNALFNFDPETLWIFMEIIKK